MDPKLKQIGDLTAEDFAAHPVWIGCHMADYDEPWYDDTDEATFRPWLGEIPVEVGAEYFAVAATCTLPDGTEHPAYLHPARRPSELMEVQPCVLLGEGHSFWDGILLPDMEARRRFLAAVGTDVRSAFPLTFEVDPHHVRGGFRIEVTGWTGFNQRNRFEVFVRRVLRTMRR